MSRNILIILFCTLCNLCVPTVLNAQTEAPFLPSSADADCERWVEAVMKKMSLKEKIGQLIVATVPATADSKTQKMVRDLVKKYKVGGLLFAEGTAEEEIILTNLANKYAKVPVMVTFDGEWGLSMRLTDVPNYPRNAALGCIADNSLIEAYGREVARQFREIGVHVNFAPVADVNTNPLNPVIHTRSFGEKPKLVAEKVIAYSRGLESGGVLSVSKHFPGHGDTDKDSHKELPALYYDRARLDSIELLPFREMVRAGLGGVMVGHLQVPELEPDRITATSLSRSVVTGLLKEEMGFKGLVFTDALDMEGVAKVPYVTTKALKAGNDVVLVQFNSKNASAELLQAARSGKLTEDEINEKCRKVLTYKYLLGARTPRAQLQLSGVSQRINTEEGHALATRLRKAAVTVVNNYFDILPLAPIGENIAILSIGKEKDKDAPFVEAMKQRIGLTHFFLPWGADEAARTEVLRQLATYRRVIICITDASSKVAQPDVQFLAALNLKAPVIYTFFTSYRCMHSLEPALAKSSAIVLAHSAEPDLQEHVAKVLFAEQPAHGRLSMSVGRTFPAGTGCDIEVGKKSGSYIPEDLGMHSYVLQRIDGLATKGVKAEAYPGCRILVWKDGKVAYDKGFGTHSPQDSTLVRPTDMFDLAALTQPVGILLAIMKLYETQKLKLTDKASKYLPYLRNGNKKNITIRELLFHESGLPPHLRFYLETIDAKTVKGPYLQGWKDDAHQTRVSEHSYYCSNFRFKKGLVTAKDDKQHALHVAENIWLDKNFKQEIQKQIASCELLGKRYIYSDLSFVVLQHVVEAITKLPIDAYLTKEFYTPMGLQRTMYLPLTRYPKAEVMPTAQNDFLRRQNLCGYVHDEIAACLGGVSGNAGLFSTTEEVAKLFQLLLNGGVWNGKRLLKESTCRLFITEKSSISRRGLGVDKPDMKNPKSSPCGKLTPETVFGHAGFTGTCAWADPDNNLVYVFLSNRLCPDVWNTKLTDMNIRTDIQDIIYQSLQK